MSFRPRGHSMTGKIEDGQLVTLEPVRDHATLEVGDIVLCRLPDGPEYLHLIKAIRTFREKLMFLIGNNKGTINGWTEYGNVYGKCIRVIY